MYFSVMTTSKDLFCMLMLSLAIRNCEKNVLVLIYEKTKSVKKIYKVTPRIIIIIIRD